MSKDKGHPYVSRAALKLEHALDDFDLDVTGLVCADFGCNIGGFTDCLLQRGASRVYAIDTGYGTLAWKLRSDERVKAMERSNALHVEPVARVDLVTIDLAWTPQRLALPAALRWLAPDGIVVTLVKPHYELDEREKEALLHEGLLPEEHAPSVLRRVVDTFPTLGFEAVHETRSPITGGKSAKRHKGRGNVEFLVLAKPHRDAELR